MGKPLAGCPAPESNAAGATLPGSPASSRALAKVSPCRAAGIASAEPRFRFPGDGGAPPKGASEPPCPCRQVSPHACPTLPALLCSGFGALRARCWVTQSPERCPECGVQALSLAPFYTHPGFAARDRVLHAQAGCRSPGVSPGSCSTLQGGKAEVCRASEAGGCSPGVWGGTGRGALAWDGEWGMLLPAPAGNSKASRGTGVGSATWDWVPLGGRRDCWTRGHRGECASWRLLCRGDRCPCYPADAEGAENTHPERSA